MTELKPCPFCGAKAILVYCVHGVGANWESNVPKSMHIE